MNDLPFLDLGAPGFSTRGPEVLAARDTHWCARTPYGFAVLRYTAAGKLLRDRRLRQGSYDWPRLQGLTGSFARFWENSIIAQEGQAHQALRALALPALAPEFIRSLIPAFEKSAIILADGFPQGGCFVQHFSEPFAGQAITTLLGLPKHMAADIARDASALGLAMQIGSKQHEPVFDAACDRLQNMAKDLINRGPGTDNFVGRLVARAAQTGGIDAQVMIDLVVIAIFGGVDTTRAQLAFAMAQFAANPGTWNQIRQNQDLIENSLEEAIRLRPTTTWATREAVVDFEMEGIRFRAGDTVHILVHASSTDPAVAQPDFDPARRQKGHFGFGGGAHHCLGQFVARTDMAAALRVLSDRWVEFSFAEPPQWLPDSGNTAPARLPLKIRRAGSQP